MRCALTFSLFLPPLSHGLLNIWPFLFVFIQLDGTFASRAARKRSDIITAFDGFSSRLHGTFSALSTTLAQNPAHRGAEFVPGARVRPYGRCASGVGHARSGGSRFGVNGKVLMGLGCQLIFSFKVVDEPWPEAHAYLR